MTRDELTHSIAETIRDYREGEIVVPSALHVEKWVQQFPANAQESILAEMDHVLKRTYFPKRRVERFLCSFLDNQALVGQDPCRFWSDIHFLNIQPRGSSQTELLDLFDGLLQGKCGISIQDSGAGSDVALYLDDGIFTGMRLLTDVKNWLASTTVEKTTLHIVTLASHRGGCWYAETEIKQAANRAGKPLTLRFWNEFDFEDRRTYIDASDVLRPTHLPTDPLIADYTLHLKFPPTLRKEPQRDNHPVFSSEQGREVLEQEFLKAGLRIRAMSPKLNQYMRPLGNMVLDTLGFGTLFVTFRNCPNNCPLALWAGKPWYPLFPRKTN